MLLHVLGGEETMSARGACRDLVDGPNVHSSFHAGESVISFPVQNQFALPQDSKPGGTIAKQPAAGPTSRLLRAFLHHRLDGWRSRLTDEARDPEPAAAVRAPALEDVPGPVLDKSRLEEFSATMSRGDLREFFWLSIVDTELRLTDIAALRAAGKLESVAEVAHRIARDAANLGAARVHIKALRLETACRAGESAGSYGLIGELSEAWTQVGDRLCAWLAEQASSPAA